jgi:hypothetical protein
VRVLNVCEKVSSRIVLESFFSEDFPRKIIGTNIYFLDELMDVFNTSLEVM